MLPERPIHNLETPPRPSVGDRKLDFDNVFCAAPLSMVAQHLWRNEAALLNRGDPVYSHIERQYLIPDFREIYLYSFRATVTLLWIWPTMTELLALLSEAAGVPVVYLSITGHMHMREFLAFDHGDLVHEVLDPEKPLRTGQWVNGANLGGHGPRRFKSLDEFLREIKPWYTPVDWVWQYGKWHFEEWRRETLALPECRIRWSLKLSVAERLIEPVGEVPDSELGNIERIRSQLTAASQNT